MIASFLISPFQFAFAEEPAAMPAGKSAVPAPTPAPSKPITDTPREVKTPTIPETVQTTSVSANKWLNSYADALRMPEVNQVSGAFTHGIPIVVPPGRNGVQPNLSLTYNSQDKNTENLFGAGWSFNIPFIERMNKSGIEDMYTATAFTSSMDGELASMSATEYGAKFESGSFRKYTFADSKWIVLEKNGTRYTFGASTASRIFNPSDSTQIYRWLLEEVRDTNGNFMTYQ